MPHSGNSSHQYRLNQFKLMVYLVTKIRFQAGGGQAAVDQVGPLLDFFSLRLIMRTRPAWSAVVKLGSPLRRQCTAKGRGTWFCDSDRDLGDLPQFNPVRSDRLPWPGRVGEAGRTSFHLQWSVRSACGAWNLFYPAFARAVCGTHPVAVDPWDAAATAAVLDAARASARTGHVVSPAQAT
jgi:hypothetical protein